MRGGGGGKQPPNSSGGWWPAIPPANSRPPDPLPRPLRSPSQKVAPWRLQQRARLLPASAPSQCRRPSVAAGPQNAIAWHQEASGRGRSQAGSVEREEVRMLTGAAATQKARASPAPPHCVLAPAPPCTRLSPPSNARVQLPLQPRRLPPQSAGHAARGASAARRLPPQHLLRQRPAGGAEGRALPRAVWAAAGEGLAHPDPRRAHPLFMGGGGAGGRGWGVSGGRRILGERAGQRAPAAHRQPSPLARLHTPRRPPPRRGPRGGARRLSARV